MEDAVNEYLLSFIDPKDKLILEMEDYAKENHVPIMDRLGMEFMLQFLRLNWTEEHFRARYSNWLF